VVPVLPVVLLVACLLIGAWAGLAAARNRRVSGAQLVTAAVVEVLLLVQAVLGVLLLARTDRDVEAVTFVGYLLTSVLLLPVGAFWAIGERSRWGNGVLAVAGLVVAVLVLRLQQVWSAGA
jgi:hypothetical protein